jgi:hypothetical protein
MPEVRRIPLTRTRVNRGMEPHRKWNAYVTKGREGRSDRHMAESQLSELQNMRVLLEEARGLSRNLAYHRRAQLESRFGEALEEVDRQIVELRAAKGQEVVPSQPASHQQVHHQYHRHGYGCSHRRLHHERHSV